jgi:hypothetical protein
MKDCGRLLCALMLVVHPLHFATYQGLPEADHARASTVEPDGTAGFRAPELPTRFDSEGPGMPVPARLSTASTAVTGTTHVIEPDSARHTVTSGTPSVTSPGTPGRFDSEQPTAAAEVLPHSKTTAATGDATVRPATVQVTAGIPKPTVVTEDVPRRFDSEPPNPSAERTDQTMQNVEGRDVRQVSGTAYLGVIGYGQADSGRFDSEEQQRAGERRDGNVGASGGSAVNVTLNDEATATDSLTVTRTPTRFDSEGPQRDGEPREGNPSSAAGGGQVVQMGQAMETDTAMSITVNKGEQSRADES